MIDKPDKKDLPSIPSYSYEEGYNQEIQEKDAEIAELKLLADPHLLKSCACSHYAEKIKELEKEIAELKASRLRELEFSKVVHWFISANNNKPNVEVAEDLARKFCSTFGTPKKEIPSEDGLKSIIQNQFSRFDIFCNGNEIKNRAKDLIFNGPIVVNHAPVGQQKGRKEK